MCQLLFQSEQFQINFGFPSTKATVVFYVSILGSCQTVFEPLFQQEVDNIRFPTPAM